VDGRKQRFVLMARWTMRVWRNWPASGASGHSKAIRLPLELQTPLKQKYDGANKMPTRPMLRRRGQQVDGVGCGGLGGSSGRRDPQSLPRKSVMGSPEDWPP